MPTPRPSTAPVPAPSGAHLPRATAVALVCGAIAVAGCGSSRPSPPSSSSSPPTTTTTPPAHTVSVTGTVARVCPGPLIVGRQPHCQDTAVLRSGARRTVVRGHFHVRLPVGTYRVTVDGCPSVEVIKLTRSLAALRLVPRCAYPA